MQYALSRLRPAHGFTLIELMITVVVVAILASIAYPSYLNQIRKSRRTEAKTLLLETTNRQERFFSTARPQSYGGSMTDLGFAKAAAPSGDSGADNAWYTVSVLDEDEAAAVTGSTCAIENCFVLEATPLRDQANDDDCGKLQIDSRGRKYVTGSADVNDCW
ncbi:MAG: pilus assembly protein PilE [Salinisphaeraceae bacterium]|nr:pilus assembly protein PilE [Salinisphaeraceae bacterium]